MTNEQLLQGIIDEILDTEFLCNLVGTTAKEVNLAIENGLSIGFTEEAFKEGATVTFRISSPDDEGHEFWYSNRFKIFEPLEKILWFYYQEIRNDDPCAFTYTYDPDHLGDMITFMVVCIDYFS
jgi:hypothetical protein